jgi:hypothetical protein
MVLGSGVFERVDEQSRDILEVSLDICLILKLDGTTK